MTKTILTLSLFALISATAHAEGKAYQYILDQKMSETACLEKAITVAALNQLVIQPKETNGDHGLNGSDGERAGVVYYSVGACHLYIF
jgi:hypothetical protein